MTWFVIDSNTQPVCKKWLLFKKRLNTRTRWYSKKLLGDVFREDESKYFSQAGTEFWETCHRRHGRPVQKGIRQTYGLKIHEWVIKGLGRIIPSTIPSTILNDGGVWEEKIAGSRLVHMFYLIASSIATVGDRIVC